MTTWTYEHALYDTPSADPVTVSVGSDTITATIYPDGFDSGVAGKAFFLAAGEATEISVDVTLVSFEPGATVSVAVGIYSDPFDPGTVAAGTATPNQPVPGEALASWSPTVVGTQTLTVGATGPAGFAVLQMFAFDGVNYAPAVFTFTSDALSVVTIELGLNTNDDLFTLGTSELGDVQVLGSGEDATAYLDVSEWARGTVTVNQGQAVDGPEWSPSANRATFLLDNEDGRFDPLNPTGPYYGQLKPGIRARVWLDDVRLFTGRVDDWPILFEQDIKSEVPVRCSGTLEEIGAVAFGQLDAPTGKGDTVNERVTELLDRMEFPDGRRDISIALKAPLRANDRGGNALEQVKNAVDSGNGVLWEDGHGRLVAKAIRELSGAPSWLLGHDSDIQWDELESGEVRQLVVNDISVSSDQEGQASQDLYDAESVAVYGRRSYNRTDFQNDEASDVGNIAQLLLARFADPDAWRPKTVTVSWVGPEVNQTFVRDVKIGDAVQVRQATNYGTTIEQAAVVTGVDWQFTPSRRDGAVTVSLWPQPPYQPLFILGQTALGIGAL